MLYFIIAVLIIVLIYVMSNQSSTSSQTLVMSSKYGGLVSNVLNWNRSSTVIQENGFSIVIRGRVSMINGESTFTLVEKPNGDLQITYKTTSADRFFKNLDIEAYYPQAVCISNHDLVWNAFKEKIENSVLDNTKSTTQDLLDDFYGK
jgi:hypothetical protein